MTTWPRSIFSPERFEAHVLDVGVDAHGDDGDVGL